MIIQNTLALYYNIYALDLIRSWEYLHGNQHKISNVLCKLL